MDATIFIQNNLWKKLFAKTLKFFVRLIKKIWNWSDCRRDPIVIYPVKKVEGKTEQDFIHCLNIIEVDLFPLHMYITYKIFLKLVCLDRKQKTMYFHLIIKELIIWKRSRLFLCSLWPLRTGPHLFSESESFTTWWTNTGPLKKCCQLYNHAKSDIGTNVTLVQINLNKNQSKCNFWHQEIYKPLRPIRNNKTSSSKK